MIINIKIFTSFLLIPIFLLKNLNTNKLYTQLYLKYFFKIEYFKDIIYYLSFFIMSELTTLTSYPITNF